MPLEDDGPIETCSGHFAAIDDYHGLARRIEAGENVQYSRLAAAGMTDDADEFTPVIGCALTRSWSARFLCNPQAQPRVKRSLQLKGLFMAAISSLYARRNEQSMCHRFRRTPVSEARRRPSFGVHCTSDGRR
jgi:hypothetical protein